MKKALAIAYVVALHAALAVAWWKWPQAAAEAKPERRVDGMRVERVKEMSGYIDANAPAGAVVFLGDSHTQRLATTSVTSHGVNLAYGGQTADQLAEALPEYKSLPKAKAVVLMIGTNDILRGEGPKLEDRLRAVVAAIPPSLPLVWSALPQIRGKEPKINSFIRGACAERPGCVFVPSPEGQLSDQVHLSANGYRRWESSLRDALAGVVPEYAVADDASMRADAAASGEADADAEANDADANAAADADGANAADAAVDTDATPSG
jgi:lysophospholipase L1-like esterase